MKIIIRTDSSTDIGSGHVMRCLVLADFLRNETMHEGERLTTKINLSAKTDIITSQSYDSPKILPHYSIIFACRNLEGNLIETIKIRGYAVEILKEQIGTANIEFLNLLKTQQPEIVIFDNYKIGEDIEIQSKLYSKYIVVIDDLANTRHDCDILLNQNPLQNNDAYRNLLPKKTMLLQGLNYALLGKKFLNVTQERIKKNQTDNNTSITKLFSAKNPINNIIIFFGGGDHKNITSSVLELLTNHKNNKFLPKDCTFEVIVGAANPNKKFIEEICKQNASFNYHCQVNNMHEFMAKANLFIGAGGTTSWERMFIGLPAIIISIAENQEKSCKYLAEEDVIQYLGRAEEFSELDFLNKLKWVQKNPKWLLEASNKGKRMVDGYGAKRVASYISSLSIQLRKAENKDCKEILKWRNNLINRRYSFNTNIIKFKDHEKWFNNIITSRNNNLLIATFSEESLAVIRFDYINSVAEISLYMVPGWHGRNYGLPLLIAAETWLKQNKPDITTIESKVIKDNIASYKVFSYAMYQETMSDNNTLFLRKEIA